MYGEFWKIDEPNQIKERLEHFENWLRTEWNWEAPVSWSPKRYEKKRSLNANALAHIWFREMASSFSERGRPITEQKMKLFMCHKFLGTETIEIGKTLIEGQVRHSSDLTSGEMMVFMDQVMAWAADHGVLLSHPQDSEYYEWSKT